MVCFPLQQAAEVGTPLFPATEEVKTEGEPSGERRDEQNDPSTSREEPGPSTQAADTEAHE